ncbi:serine/threonine-protein kinase WNK (With No Lysine)-like protein [Wolffia australiana]
MEEHLTSFAMTHLLQHTLRSLCIHEDSKWVYAVFWRILPRNYPPPQWDLRADGAVMDRTRGNRRNWILAWEDGFCNFAASSSGDGGLQPAVFFKMSHEIYNYGEGLVGKVAADRSHKWVFKDQGERESCLMPSWHSPSDTHPRTWESQFKAGIKTIVLIAVREGVIQLGAISKVMEDPSLVLLLRDRFAYLETIPGVLLPHPSSVAAPEGWPGPPLVHYPIGPPPAMSSLEALLSTLPAVCPPSSPPSIAQASKEELGDCDYSASPEMNGHGLLSSMPARFLHATRPGHGC